MLKNEQTLNDKVQLIETYVWACVVLIVTVILAGIVMAMLYSVTFVVQPIKSMAPIDQAYLKMMNDIVLLIVGGIGGVMSRKGVHAIADKISSSPSPSKPSEAPSSAPVSPSSAPTSTWTAPSSAMPVWVNPPLDETWTPPPPPTTPPNHLEPDSVREEIAQARREAALA
jgi:hypothetical protein